MQAMPAIVRGNDCESKALLSRSRSISLTAVKTEAEFERGDRFITTHPTIAPLPNSSTLTP